MKRVLKGANFSLTKIGNIDVPELDTNEAKTAVARYSGITTANKNKLIKFINALVNGGVYNKIKYMMLPTVAASVNDALQNVVAASKDVVTNTIATLDANGVIMGAQKFVIGNKTNLTNRQNFTISYKFYETSATGRVARILSLSGNVTESAQSRIYFGGDGTATMNNISNASGSYTKWVKTISIAIASFNNGEILQRNNGVYLDVVTYTPDNKSTLDAAAYISSDTESSSGTGTLSLGNHLQMIMIAEPMTTAEMTVFYDAAEEFFT